MVFVMRREKITELVIKGKDLIYGMYLGIEGA